MRKMFAIYVLLISLLAGSFIFPAGTAAAATPVPGSQAAVIEPSGPLTYPAGVNPLTGLPEENPADLELPPALVSISTFPPSTRPQSGLSFSPWVFELFIGEGMSRYLALFYGSYPRSAVDEADALTADGPRVGPIRSGRLPYESVRKLYNGFLVMASAYSSVAEKLSEFTDIYGMDDDVKGGSSIKVADLRSIAEKYRGKLRMTAEGLGGMRFDSQPPNDGKAAAQIWYPVALLNQVVWKYDPAAGAYTRWQDNGDGTTFIQQSDKLNGEPLTYENVVILFAPHHRYADTLMDIDLMYINKAKAVLFRDGQKYDLFWTTRSGEYEQKTGLARPIRFIDKDGNPFPFKPGQTWVHLTPENAPVYETAPWETDDIKDAQLAWQQHKKSREEGSGYWTVDFYQPAIEPKK
ncbi:MAG: DUF3048 domain-containing protein [Chloroflexi bacterium]|nr:DUF3048 domain-containing protein [Chloroflexota bacterium]BCY17679.1 hypothetical protein hrd7_15280 [Leptolinea sp. HRD-7]